MTGGQNLAFRARAHSSLHQVKSFARFTRQPTRWILRANGSKNGSAPPSSNNNNNNNSDSTIDWAGTAFPSYMQRKTTPRSSRCESWDNMWTDAIRADDARRAAARDGNANTSAASVSSVADACPLWDCIREEAERDARTEPILSSFLYASILAHDSFERALSFVLANRLADVTLLSTELFELFYDILTNAPGVQEKARADCEAVRDRDPACTSYCACLLYFKGFHAVQSYRIAHALWSRGQKVMALALQSRISEVFAVDIHPAAQIGRGILLDHGTGVVIGETAVIGDDCSLLQGVTLGGTGKEVGDRHPKIGNGVLIGAQATILGNIPIGDGAQVAAGSLVLKPVSPHQMVAGNPAKVVGMVEGEPALRMQQWYQRIDEAMTNPSSTASQGKKGKGGVGAKKTASTEPPSGDDPEYAI